MGVFRGERGATKARKCLKSWLRGVDLNHRPLGYEPNELPDCSTPRFDDNNLVWWRQFFSWGRWHASTIFVGSMAELSICSSRILPSFPIRKFTRRAALYLFTYTP
jgi:hypothetical protein